MTVRYKVFWDNLKDEYQVWDTEVINPLGSPKIIGNVSNKAMNTLLTKLVLHANRINQPLSDSFIQLADEVSQDFSEYVAILSGHKAKEVQNLTDVTQEMVDILSNGVEQLNRSIGSMVSKVETVKDSLPKVISRRED